MPRLATVWLKTRHSRLKENVYQFVSSLMENDELGAKYELQELETDMNKALADAEYAHAMAVTRGED